eukprot:scaffold1667_cov258-Pinguiococcus_pyrenoidosus.AAC.6
MPSGDVHKLLSFRLAASRLLIRLPDRTLQTGPEPTPGSAPGALWQGSREPPSSRGRSPRESGTLPLPTSQKTTRDMSEVDQQAPPPPPPCGRK